MRHLVRYLVGLHKLMSKALGLRRKPASKYHGGVKCAFHGDDGLWVSPTGVAAAGSAACCCCPLLALLRLAAIIDLSRTEHWRFSEQMAQ